MVTKPDAKTTANIIKLYEMGYGNATLCSYFSLGSSTISKIIKQAGIGRTWKESKQRFPLRIRSYGKEARDRIDEILGVFRV